ncbi:hypothetical protein CCP3SC5AM1_830008 [Gammaproteobacteria bacterium]
MIDKNGQYAQEDLQSIRTVIGEFTEIFRQREANGRPITLVDLADKSAGESAACVDRLLALVGIPRLCGTDTLWKLLYLMDHQIPEGRAIVPDAVRQWLLGSLWEALEAQERSVVNGLSGLLVVVRQACLTQHQSSDSESSDSRIAIIEQGNRARDHICAFVRRYPSLLTFGVQSRLMDSDDPEIARAFVESFQGIPDFVTQQAIISTQDRLRARGILEPLKALVESGMQAARILSEGMSAVMETVNNDIRGNPGANIQQGQRIETQVAALQGELNNGRATIARLRNAAEQELDHHRPVLYLSLMRCGQLAPYVAGEIVTTETRINSDIAALAKQLTARREQAEQARAMIVQNVREVFDQLRENKEIELRRIESDLQRNRLGWEKDPHREGHYAAEIKRLEGEFRTQRVLSEQQAVVRNNVESRIEKLASIQIALLERLISQINALHERVRTQTREVLQQMITIPLASEKQIAIVDFGDRDLIIGLITNLRDKLSHDTQVRIATSTDLELHAALVRTLGNTVVTAARRHISSSLLVSSFDESALIADLCF